MVIIGVITVVSFGCQYGCIRVEGQPNERMFEYVISWQSFAVALTNISRTTRVLFLKG
jgi:hypothetical protein